MTKDLITLLGEAELASNYLKGKPLHGIFDHDKYCITVIKLLKAAPQIKVELLQLRELEKIALEVLEASNNTTASIWKLRLREILEGK